MFINFYLKANNLDNSNFVGSYFGKLNGDRIEIIITPRTLKIFNITLKFTDKKNLKFGFDRSTNLSYSGTFTIENNIKKILNIKLSNINLPDISTNNFIIKKLYLHSDNTHISGFISNNKGFFLEKDNKLYFEKTRNKIYSNLDTLIGRYIGYADGDITELKIKKIRGRLYKIIIRFDTLPFGGFFSVPLNNGKIENLRLKSSDLTKELTIELLQIHLGSCEYMNGVIIFNNKKLPFFFVFSDDKFKPITFFPCPIPIPTSSRNISLNPCKRLSDIDTKIKKMLFAAGYNNQPFNYFRIKDGFVVMTPIEKIRPNGEPNPLDRWVIQEDHIEVGFIDWVSETLGFTEESLYRVFVFVIQENDCTTFSAGDIPQTVGFNTLPNEMGAKLISTNIKITAFLYVFKKTYGNSNLLKLDNSNKCQNCTIDIQSHMIKTNINLE